MHQSLAICALVFSAFASAGTWARKTGHLLQGCARGTLDDDSVDAVALDYSLQVEEAFTRMWNACKVGALTRATPPLCISSKVVVTASCPKANSTVALKHTKTLAHYLGSGEQWNSKPT